VDPVQAFGRNLRAQRQRQGLSQEALGHAAGLHLSEVSRLERGEREPRLGTVVKLSRALGTTPSALLRGVE
jgi:transcriptional regulator with XRE-family HTH domain